MNTDIKFAANVILIDTEFLNNTIHEIRQVLSERIGRPLPPLDLVQWATCLLLDGGLCGSDNETQILLVHPNKQDMRLTDCTPDSLNELDGKACSTPLGEFSFTCVTDEGLVPHEHLYLDLATLLLNAEGMERLLFVPSTQIPADELVKAIRQAQKETKDGGTSTTPAHICWSGMMPPQSDLPCTWIPAAYSLAHTFGIKENEMK